jgi:hypothetical protein
MGLRVAKDGKGIVDVRINGGKKGNIFEDEGVVAMVVDEEDDWEVVEVPASVPDPVRVLLVVDEDEVVVVEEEVVAKDVDGAVAAVAGVTLVLLLMDPELEPELVMGRVVVAFVESIVVVCGATGFSWFTKEEDDSMA